MNFKVNWGKHSYGDIKVIGGTIGIINVGNYCSIGENVQAFVSNSHKIYNISTFPFGKLYKQIPVSTYKEIKKHEINIGNDVFIGSHAVIFNDVTIGDGAVIGAFATITKDVEPYSVVVGNNRVVNKRFLDNDINFLLTLKWWNFEDKEVEKIASILCSNDITELKRIYG